MYNWSDLDKMALSEHQAYRDMLMTNTGPSPTAELSPTNSSGNIIRGISANTIIMDNFDSLDNNTLSRLLAMDPNIFAQEYSATFNIEPNKNAQDKIKIDFQELSLNAEEKKELGQIIKEWLDANKRLQENTLPKWYYYGHTDDITDLPIILDFSETKLSSNEQRGLTVRVGEWLNKKGLVNG